MIDTDVVVHVTLADDDCFEIPDSEHRNRRLRVTFIQYRAKGDRAYVSAKQVYSHGGMTANPVIGKDMLLKELPDPVLAAIINALSEAFVKEPTS